MKPYVETEGERALRKRCDELEKRIEAMEVASGLFASDKDLDSPKGNPSVKMDPRDWSGPRCKNKKYSECPPDFLDVYAKTLLYFSEHPKEGKEKYAEYDRIDAGRARSWARRLRSGWAPATIAAPDFPSDPMPDASGFEAPSFTAPSFDQSTPENNDDDFFGNTSEGDGFF